MAMAKGAGVVLWDLQSGRQLSGSDKPSGPVKICGSGPRGLYTLSEGGLEVWDAGKRIGCPLPEGERAEEAAVLPEKNLIATLNILPPPKGQNQNIYMLKLWNLDGKLLRQAEVPMADA